MELFDRLQTTDSLLNRIQDKLMRVINAIARKEILDGRLIEDITVTPSTTRIEHKLGRVPRGWIVANGTPDLIVESSRDDRFLVVSSAGGTATIDIWVF